MLSQARHINLCIGQCLLTEGGMCLRKQLFLPKAFTLRIFFLNSLSNLCHPVSTSGLWKTDLCTELRLTICNLCRLYVLQCSYLKGLLLSVQEAEMVDKRIFCSVCPCPSHVRVDPKSLLTSHIPSFLHSVNIAGLLTRLLCLQHRPLSTGDTNVEQDK